MDDLCYGLTYSGLFLIVHRPMSLKSTSGWTLTLHASPSSSISLMAISPSLSCQGEDYRHCSAICFNGLADGAAVDTSFTP